MKFVVFNPIRMMQWVLAAVSLVQGLYVFSPLYEYSIAVNGMTPFAAALAHPLLVYIYAALLIITAIMIIVGLVKDCPRIRSAGLLGQTTIRFYNALTTVLTTGFLPIVWTYAFTVVLFSAILWLVERVKLQNGS